MVSRPPPKLSPQGSNVSHMDVAKTEPASVENKPLASLATRAASVLALPVLGVISYGAPYITGLVYRQEYLGSFNVPETLFKSDAITYFTYAYAAVLNVYDDWMGFLSSPRVWLGMIALIAVFLFEIVALYRLPKTAWANSLSESLSRNKYVALTTGLLSFAVSVTVLILLIPVVIFPVIIMPGIVGNYGAKHSVSRSLASYDKGCAAQTSPRDQCQVIMDGARIVAAGFLVTSSDTRVVVYHNHLTKIIPLKDYTIESLPPESYKALIAAGKIP